jgi:hypothetical protein
VFRGAGGLWEGNRVEEVATTPEAWAREPEIVLRFYNMRRRAVAAAQPNAAHFALARLETRHAVTIITQNIDDLHERAGSSRLIHLHGEIMKAPVVVKLLPCAGDRGLFGNDPGMKGAANASQTLQRSKGAHCAPGYPDQAEHFSLKFLKAHQIKDVLQNPAASTMILRGSQYDAARLLNLLSQPEYILCKVRLVIFSVAKGQPVVVQVDQLGCASELFGPFQGGCHRHFGITSRTETPGDPHDSTCIFLSAHVITLYW